MDTSTPVHNKKRDQPMIEEQEESPICQAVHKTVEPSDDSASSDSIEPEKSMKPTGVTNELWATHLTTPPVETSSMENRGLYRRLTTGREQQNIVG